MALMEKEEIPNTEPKYLLKRKEKINQQQYKQNINLKNTNSLYKLEAQPTEPVSLT